MAVLVLVEFTQTRNIAECKLKSLHILVQCQISIPPENVRKPMFF